MISLSEKLALDLDVEITERELARLKWEAHRRRIDGEVSPEEFDALLSEASGASTRLPNRAQLIAAIVAYAPHAWLAKHRALLQNSSALMFLPENRSRPGNAS